MSSGALEGWSWGQGNFQQGVELPAIPFDQICSDAPGASKASLPSPTDRSGSPTAAMSLRGQPPSRVQPGSSRKAGHSAPPLPGGCAYMLAPTILIVIQVVTLHRKNKNGEVYVWELG